MMATKVAVDEAALTEPTRTTAVAVVEVDPCIWVVSNRDDHRIVLHERDSLHPGGEVYIDGSLPVKVGLTFAVQQRLEQKRLVEISAEQAKAELDTYNEDRMARELADVETHYPGITKRLAAQGVSLQDAGMVRTE